MQILTISNIPSGILDAIDELAADPMGGYPEAWTQFTVNITGSHRGLQAGSLSGILSKMAGPKAPARITSASTGRNIAAYPG